MVLQKMFCTNLHFRVRSQKVYCNGHRDIVVDTNIIENEKVIVYARIMSGQRESPYIRSAPEEMYLPLTSLSAFEEFDLHRNI